MHTHSSVNIAAWADRNLELFGDYDAVIATDACWTNAAAHAAAARLATALLEIGVVPGDRVALVLPNGGTLVAGTTAVWRAGAAAVLLAPSATPVELQRAVQRSAPTAVIAPSALAPIIDRLELPRGARTICSDGDAPASWIALRELIDRHTPLARPVDRSADDVAQVFYTSGTTGPAKGVFHTHGSLGAVLTALSRNNLRSSEAAGADAELDVGLIALPMTHIFGGGNSYLRRLALKYKLICLERFDPAQFLSAIARHRVSFTQLAPTMCEALLAYPELDRHDLSSLRVVGAGGAPVSPSLIDRFEARFGLRLSAGYSLTELPGVAIRGQKSKPGSAGRLLPGVEVRIVADDGRILEPGETGQILVKSPKMSRQYLGEGTASIEDGWLRTGDLGHVDRDRELFVLGRSKEIIIQAGAKVFPQPVIDVLARLPGVADCAVVGIPNEALGEEAVACVVRSPDADLTADGILAHCRASIDARLAPVSVWFTDALPRSELGKLRMEQLRDEIVSARSRIRDTAAALAVQTALPARRAALIRAELMAMLERVAPRASAADPDATFGERGLTSLGAVELSNALTELFGRLVPATLTFNHPTIESAVGFLVELVSGAAPDRAAAAAPAIRAAVPPGEPAAIIGIACRLPGGIDDPSGLWQLLDGGRHTIGELARWNMDALYSPTRGAPGTTYTRRGSLFAEPDLFDAEFFGLGPREAAKLAPDERLLLEVSWQALESAGYDPRGVPGATGVFVGIGATVNAAMAVGRISRLLDLRGPSLAIDTACSSSLVAIHQAVQSLRRGDSDVAIAGGVNMIDSAQSFVGLAAIQALAADGCCKAFDRSADGYGRGEGCVLLVLKRLGDARRDGDPVLAVIRGSAVNHDGRSSSMTAPNGNAQQAVIRAALDDAGVLPAAVDLLEAHGTGTPLGDPIEVEAATAVLAAGRDPARRLVIGSVKTNLGHLEAAAGVAGVAKVVLSLQRQVIPRHLQFRELNPHLAPFAERFEIPVEPRPWPATAGRPRIGAVTSMGLSGTNAHVVIEEAGPAPAEAAAGGPTEQLLCLSARSERALADLARRYRDHLAEVDDAAWRDVCFTAGSGRAHFSHRLAVAAPTPAAARERLLALEDGIGEGVASGVVAARPPIAFLFTGQGSQYPGMGAELYQTEPVFRAAIERCADLLAPMLPRPLQDIMFGHPPGGPEVLTLDDAALAQPALFALEWALAQLWRSWGIEPDFVLGHSLGEYVAACVAGVFDVAAGLALVAARGRLTQSLARDGAMVRVAADEARVQRAIASSREVAIAGVNGPRSTVISGDRAAVDAASAALRADGIDCKPLHVAYAYHSPKMDPILDEFERAAAAVTFAPMQIPLVSTLTGRLASDAELSDSRYWRRHLREAVRFAAGMAALADAGCGAFVEIGPSPVLIEMGRHCVPEPGARAWVASLRRGATDRAQITGALGGLYVAGVEPSWQSLHGDQAPRRLSLPTYPFQRRRHIHLSARGGGSDPLPANRSAGASTEPTSTAAARESPQAAFQRRIAALPGAERVDAVIERLRRIAAPILGSGADTIGRDDNLLEHGFDSLRVMDLLNGVGRATAIVCSPADFTARPTLARFAAHLVERIADAAERAGPAPIAPPPRSPASPLVVIRATGPRRPVFCIHPAGGQVSAYLRLGGLLGPDQPLYAIQSRAGDDADREHPAIAAMAIDYATLIQSARPDARYALLGWSLGAVAAHAIAGELERRGAAVDRVVMIDPIPPPLCRMDDVAQAVSAVLLDMSPSLRIADAIRSELGVIARAAPPDELAAWCRRHQLLPEAVADSQFAARLSLWRHHLGLVSQHRPTAVAAPLVVWWAGERFPADYWSKRTRAGATQRPLDADHFSIVGEPHLRTIAADLAGALDRET